MSIRTDLAAELKEDLETLPEGVEYENNDYKQFDLSHITITSSAGAKAMNKPMGSYVTLESRSPIAALPPKDRSKMIRKGAKALADMIDDSRSVLIIGLGNSMVTADSLGPKVCGHVFVTRHILRHIPQFLDEHTASICAIAPGVLGVTGLESAEVVKGIVNRISPSAVIAIDSLAARNTRRLGASIQITDTGICPGAGLGNHREELSQKTLGIPVIAVGVPTVVYTNTIISDVLENALQWEHPDTRSQLIRKAVESNHSDLVVTPKDIDVLTDQCAKVIAEILDLALNPHIPRTEIDEIRS